MDSRISFDELYETYYEKIFRYVLKHLQNWHEAEDLTADIFVAAYRYLPEYDQEKSLISTWIIMIASSRLKNYYRDKKATQPYNSEEAERDIGQITENMCENAVLMKEEAKQLSSLIKEVLNEREQKILIYYYFYDWPVSRIAIEMSVSPGNVRVIMSRALKKLKRRSIERNLF